MRTRLEKTGRLDSHCRANSLRSFSCSELPERFSILFKIFGSVVVDFVFFQKRVYQPSRFETEPPADMRRRKRGTDRLRLLCSQAQ